MAVTRDTLVGLAEFIDAGTDAVWSPSAAYTSGQVGIVIGRLPTAPATLVGLSPYPILSAEPDGEAGILGVQLRFRATNLGALSDLRDAVFAILDHCGPRSFGGQWAAQMWRQSGTALQDLGGTDLPECADNYYMLQDR